MEYLMFSVKDEMTGKLMNPMFIENGDYAEQQAIRQFRSNVNNIKLWKDNPNDFSLYQVGIFDDEAGAMAIPLKKIIGGRAVYEPIQNEN